MANICYLGFITEIYLTKIEQWNSNMQTGKI